MLQTLKWPFSLVFHKHIYFPFYVFYRSSEKIEAIMSKLLWWFLVFTLVVMVDQTEGLWRRRRRRRRSCSARSCDVSSWSWWSSCSQSCGWGRQSRSRDVISSASCGGSCPYALYGSQSCINRYCPGEEPSLHTV